MGPSGRPGLEQLEVPEPGGIGVCRAVVAHVTVAIAIDVFLTGIRIEYAVVHGIRNAVGVGTRNIELESEERRLFFQCGLERANPFWHRPLLELVLQLPAYWFHRDGRDKVLTRETFQNLLPAGVLESGRVGLLDAFFLRGIEQHRQALSESVFKRPQSDWQRYVRREWLEPYLADTDSISFGHTILWRTISYELWYRNVLGHRDH